MARLEHVNLTVNDPDAVAEGLCAVFGWSVRWVGETRTGERAVHVGEADSYVALFAAKSGAARSERYALIGGFNHLGIVVDDLDAVAQRAEQAGFGAHHHEDYEPGRRFYFMGPEDIEIEVVSYV